MLKHSSLSPELLQLTRSVSGIRTFIQLSSIVTTVLITWWAALYLNHWITVLLASTFTGFALSGFINAAHECTHNTQYRSKALNQLAGTLMCMPLLLNYHLYRWQHLDHHKYVGTPKDTEMHRCFPNPKAYLISMLGLGYWRYAVVTIWQCLCSDFPPSVNRPRKQRAVWWNALLLLGFILTMVLITYHWPLASFWGYWWPMIIAIVCINLFSLAEHYEIKTECLKISESRTIISNAFVRHFIWNANFHNEHHLFPTVQSCHLHRVHQHIASVGFEKCSSYFRYHRQVFRKLKLQKSEELMV